MYDVIRWTLLVVLFAGLLSLWLWSRRRAGGIPNRSIKAGKTFQVTQKRWLDQRTGVCLVEAEGQDFLLAYTVGGGVSWQPLAVPASVSPKNVLSERVL